MEFTILINEDDISESDETFDLNLSIVAPSGNDDVQANPNFATVVIRDTARKFSKQNFVINFPLMMALRFFFSGSDWF